MGHTTQLRGMASTLSMRTSKSPEQRQPGQLAAWHSQTERDSKVAAYHLPFTAEAGAKHPFKRQLHTIQNFRAVLFKAT